MQVIGNRSMLRKFHRVIGYILMLPIITWMLTGLFFFFKPGYADAYAALPIKQYPISDWPSVEVNPEWHQVKLMQSVLGQHILIKDASGWSHFDIETKSRMAQPSSSSLKILVNDAISIDPKRYGKIVEIHDTKFITDTGVAITFDWNTMSLRQQGKDTQMINQIYNIHYLRWTGNKTFDQFAGVIGLLSLVLLAVLGVILSLKKRAKPFRTDA
jgi:uncharacterized iron-regulated membrane protein